MTILVILVPAKIFAHFFVIIKELHVLAVDNNVIDRKIMEKLLISSSCKNYCMPEITDYELLKKIKGSAILKDIPVIIMCLQRTSQLLPTSSEFCDPPGYFCVS
ncbi:hypothetical protein M9H77_12420 [Catharanthus roseus]|uniref:Uncharacterized protein n=1 Tax=Catharanthus roseus TaxID=4058 RepID=A0ACC0BHG2_CATRO|nr:hypothetical protein M9H77_12420 [Catharanthus roseus]